MRILQAVVLLTSVSAMAAPEPGLPGWDAVMREQASEPLFLQEPKAGEDQVLELPDSPAEPTNRNEEPEEFIPQTHWSEYFERRPGSFLIDPQKLLSPVEFRERLAFLNYHSGDSAIDLYAYVIRAGQSIPGEVREEEMMERLFASGKPAVAALYFLGEPQRTVMRLSPSLAQVIPAAELRRALESAIIHSLKETDPARQFQAFLVHASIRIYLMERTLDGEDESQSAVVDSPVAETQENSGQRDALQHIRALAARHWPLAMCVTTALVALFVAHRGLKRRSGLSLPDFDVEPRLGGAHAAGVGAVISFASASVPPASQRDALPDYLRRA